MKKILIIPILLIGFVFTIVAQEKKLDDKKQVELKAHECTEACKKSGKCGSACGEKGHKCTKACCHKTEGKAHECTEACKKSGKCGSACGEKGHKCTKACCHKTEGKAHKCTEGSL